MASPALALSGTNCTTSTSTSRHTFTSSAAFFQASILSRSVPVLDKKRVRIPRGDAVRHPFSHPNPEPLSPFSPIFFPFLTPFFYRYWGQSNDVPNLRASAVFDPKTCFGGDGAGPNLCVADGPLTKMRLHFNEDVTIATNTSGYCLSRSMSECFFANTVKQNVEACLKAATCEEMWRCLEAKPHITGH